MRDRPGAGYAAGALAEVGWVAQVLVNRTTGHVVDGHLRVELAISRREPTVPVLYVELTEAEEYLVLATLDPLAAMATAEKDALAALLAGLQTGDAALARMLADLADEHGVRRPVLGDPDDVPPVPDEADVYVKAGDIWVLGDHRLLCGDATDPAAVSRLLDGAEPTLLATDPPYGVSLDPTWRDGVYNRVTMPDGRRCRAGPQHERPFCFAHDPERATEAAEARRLGGLRRRREGTVSVAYDLPGLETVEGIRRLLDIVVVDGLGLENGIARLRVLIAVVGAATKLLETGELEERIAALELATSRPTREPASVHGLLAG